MRRLLLLIALAAGALSPAAGAFGTPSATAQDDTTGIGIRLVDAPVATRDNPRASVYIIDHVKPGTTIERRIEVSNGTGEPSDIAVYPAAAAIKGGSFVGLEGDTPNELSTWTTVSTPRLRMPGGAKEMVDVTIDVPSDAPPGEQYAVLWAQATSGKTGAITQVSRVGIRVYLSVGPGGEPASAFDIESFTAGRDPSGAPVVAATIHNTGGRALDLRGKLTLRDGPGGLTAGPFPVTLGTTLGLGAKEPVSVRLDEQLPAGPWKAHLEVTSGLLTEKARASLTFPESGTGETVPASPDDESGPPWPMLGGALLVLLAVAVLVWWLLRRRRSAGPGTGTGSGSDGGGSRRHSSSSRPAGAHASARLTRTAGVRRRRRAAWVACLAAGPLLALSAPAVADQSAGTQATVSIVGGGLSITAPADAGSLASSSSQVGAVTVSGRLGQVQVTDSRGAPQGSGWTATAISTAFTPPAGPAVGAAFVGYTAGPITKTGTATYLANDPADLTGVSPVVTATGISGDNTATWNPTIDIDLTANLAAGVYSGTITHSVS